MANRLANLLGNTKTRTLVLLVLGMLVFGVVIAVSQSGSKDNKNAAERVSKTTDVPNQVKSTPGAQVSRKYYELQEKANARGAQDAAKKGTTFIPTLTGATEGYSDADFDKQLSSAYDDLGGKCSKETVTKLKKEGMDTTKIIMQLKSYGCSAAAIAALFNSDEIAAALLAAKDCADASNIKGCSADDAKKLKTLGYDSKKIAATFKANNCTTAQIVSALKANGAGIDEITAALKANGVDAAEIASALAKAGFSKTDILTALTKAGFSSLDVAKAISALDLDKSDNASLAALRQNDNQRLTAQQEAQQLSAFSQQRQGKIQELVTAMDAQRKQAMDSWTAIPAQSFVQGEWATAKDKADKAGTTTAGYNQKGANGKTKGGIILKAGSIFFAVLDTAVNSDEPGPVMATIVSGTLKGSKLLGSMKTQTSADKISLTFTAINMPDEASSMGIQAVAIDPDTARTAMASDVDHHYLLRWGSLFASAFVQGYSSSIANAGTTTVASTGLTGTTTTTTNAALNPKQALFQGLSQFGSQWGSVVAQNFNTPNTITIDQGTGVGILLTTDLTYGSDPVFYQAPATTNAAGEQKPLAQGTIASENNAANATSTPQQQQTASLINALQQVNSGQTAATNNGGNR